MTDATGQPTRYAMIPIEVRVPVDLRHDQDVAAEIALAAQEFANEEYGRDYDGSEPEQARLPLPEAQQSAVYDSILSTVSGTVFRSETGEVIVMLNEDNYAISVDPDGHTVSAYLVTVAPATIAAAMDADEGEISGWSTGWDC
jgi:hypothetical protein